MAGHSKMIIESVRSVAVPEEGKPYRKIKVSSDIRSRLPPNVVKDAVSSYIRDKVNHILRGDCVVEVHWNGVDVRTLHLRSIQPLSSEEVLSRRQSEAVSADSERQSSRFPSARLPLGEPRRPILLPPMTTNFSIRRPPIAASSSASATASATTTTLPSPLPSSLRSSLQSPLRSSLQSPLRSPLRSPLPSPLRSPLPLPSPIPSPSPSMASSSSSLPSLSTSLQSVLSTAYQGSRKKLRVIAINGPLGGKPLIHTPAATSSDRSSQRGGQIILPPRVAGTVTGFNSKDAARTVVAHQLAPRHVLATNVPPTVARTGVQTIVPIALSASSLANAPRIIARIRTPGASVMQASLASAHRRAFLAACSPRPSMTFSPQNCRSIRMAAPSVVDARQLPVRLPTPVSNILPSRIEADCDIAVDEVVLQPTDLPAHSGLNSFPGSKTAQRLATIAPVVSVRQVAASNPNLNVRVNGSVIRAVPGQVIRRVTGEIVRVLDNGSLEPVKVRVSPKPIITSRDEPISLDSESDADSSSDESSTDTDLEVVIRDSKSKKKSLRIAAARIRSVSNQPAVHKVKHPDDDELDPLPTLETAEWNSQLKTELITPDISHSQDDIFDSELLTPSVQLSEGSPYTQQEINNLGDRAQHQQIITEDVAEDSSLLCAVKLNDDGELELDPDLFERYIKHLIHGEDFIEPEPAAEDISYLFHRKPRSKSKCPVVEPVTKRYLLPNAQTSAPTVTSDTSDTEPGRVSSPDLNDCEPARKKAKLQQKVTVARRTYSRLNSPAKELNPHREKLKVTLSKTVRNPTQYSTTAEWTVSPALQTQQPYFFKGIKVSEPVDCREAFVVMDRLKTFKNRKTVYLQGIHKKRSLLDLFEASRQNLYFDYYEGCVNPNVKRKFQTMIEPLRAINDPNRGQLVSEMAQCQTTTGTIVSNNVANVSDLNDDRISGTGCKFTATVNATIESIDVDSIQLTES